MARLSTYLRIHNWSILVCKVSAADELSTHTKPSDLGCYYGARGQDGADLVAHGGSTGLLKYLPNGRERAGVEAELDDGRNVLRLHLYHVGFDTVGGFAWVYGADLVAWVHNDDVVVVEEL